MLQGTTPFLTMTVEGADLTDATEIIFSIKNCGRVMNFSKDRIAMSKDGDDTVLVVHLQQEETLNLYNNFFTVQVRWKDQNGEVHGAECDDMIPISEAFYKEVI